MADTILTKKITDLPEGTEINDADLIMTGVNGTASLRKNKWSKFVEKLRSILFVDSCASTETAYGLTAKQGKLLQDQVNDLNTKLKNIGTKRIYNTNAATATPGNVATLKFDSEIEGCKNIGIACFFIGNRNMTLYNLNMSQMQLQNSTSTDQKVDVGQAYIDIVYINNQW